MYPGVGTFVLIRPTQTFYERIKLEPGTPPPLKRLQALERLTDAGVKAGVALAPVIPGITDSVPNLEDIARAAASHNAQFLWASMLYLKPGTKEHFLSFLRREYPDLQGDYGHLYPGSYAPKWAQSQMQRRVRDIERAHGLEEPRAGLDAVAQPRQMELPLV